MPALQGGGLKCVFSFQMPEWSTRTLNYRLSLAVLTLWLLFNRYLLLCMLFLKDDLLMADLKFCFRLWKPALQMHNTEFSDKVTRRPHTFERFSWFKYGESLVEDCGCSGSSSTDYMIQFIHSLVFSP